VPQRGRDVQGGKHFGSCGFYIGFEAFYPLAFLDVLAFDAVQFDGGLLLFPPRALGCFLPLGESETSWLAPGRESGQLGPNLIRPSNEGLDLLSIEVNLLLAAVDVELTNMDALSSAGRAFLVRDKRRSHPAEVCFGFGHL
jgi:hypothetical protein